MIIKFTWSDYIAKENYIFFLFLQNLKACHIINICCFILTDAILIIRPIDYVAYTCTNTKSVVLSSQLPKKIEITIF